jgi:hypothetical protein
VSGMCLIVATLPPHDALRSLLAEAPTNVGLLFASIDLPKQDIEKTSELWLAPVGAKLLLRYGDPFREPLVEGSSRQGLRPDAGVPFSRGPIS